MRAFGLVAAASCLAVCATSSEPKAFAQSTQETQAPAAKRDDGGGNAGLKTVGVAAIVIGAAGVVGGSVTLLVGAIKRGNESGGGAVASSGTGLNGRGTIAGSGGTSTGDTSGFGTYDVAGIVMGAGTVLLGIGVALVTLGASHAPERVTQTATGWVRPTRVEPLVGARAAGLRVRF